MKKILIVDDERKIRNMYTKLFSKAGFNVIATSNAMDANNVLLEEKVDVMLLDINMPEVDGGTLGEITNAFYKKTKVVVASVYPVDEQKFSVFDADEYHDKSDSNLILLEKINRLLGTDSRPGRESENATEA